MARKRLRPPTEEEKKGKPRQKLHASDWTAKQIRLRKVHKSRTRYLNKHFKNVPYNTTEQLVKMYDGASAIQNLIRNKRGKQRLKNIYNLQMATKVMNAKTANPALGFEVAKFLNSRTSTAKAKGRYILIKIKTVCFIDKNKSSDHKLISWQDVVIIVVHIIIVAEGVVRVTS